MENLQDNIVTKEDNVSVSFHSELMNNYFPESSIENAGEIRTLMVGEDQPLIFYQDSKGLLNAILRQEGTESGWLPFELSKEEVKSYEFEYNTENDSFQIAKVEGNQVWVSQSLNISGTNFEKLGDILTWKSLSANTGTEIIDKVSIGTKHVLFGTSEKGKDALYYLAELSTLEAKSYTFPENAKSIIQFELGNYDYSNGVFFLYGLGSDRTMLYQSFPDPKYPDNTTKARFIGEDTINGFALMESDGGNDTLYAVGSQVNEFKGPEGSSADGTHVVLPGTYQNSQKIRVAFFEGEKSVWVLDDAGLQYQTNRFFDQTTQEFSVGKSWTAPLLMVEGASQFSCAKGKGVRNQLYAISTEYGSELTRLWQDSVTTLWNTNKVALSNLDKLKEVESYSAQVRFNTSPNLKSFSGQNVYLSSESNLFIYVNNKSYHLGPDHKVAIPLGLMPEFTIICPVGELGASNITISADFLQNEKVIDLTGKVYDRLQNKIDTGNGLVGAKKQNGKNLIPNGVSDATVKSAQEGISKMIGVAKDIRNNNSSSFQTTSFSVGGAATSGVSAGLLASSASDFGHSLGDFLHSIWTKTKEAFEFIMEKVKDGFKFVIKIGEKVFNWIVKTIREVGGFIQKVFHAIEVFFKDLFEFLAFLFQWDDIIETKRAYKGFVKNAVKGLGNEIGAIRKYIDATLDAEIAKFDPKNVGIPDELNDKVNVNAAPKESKPDPRANWLDSKRQYISQGKEGEVNQNMPTEFSDVFEQFIQKLSPIFQETGSLLLDQMKLVGSAFSDVINGKMTFVDFLKFALDRLAVAGLTLLKALVDIILETLEMLIKVAEVGMNKEWHIPIITPLYEKISGGDPLTFLDAMCLLVAIPSTILFKIGEGKAPFASKEIKDAFVNSGTKVFQLNLN